MPAHEHAHLAYYRAGQQQLPELGFLWRCLSWSCPAKPVVGDMVNNHVRRRAGIKHSCKYCDLEMAPVLQQRRQRGWSTLPDHWAGLLLVLWSCSNPSFYGLSIRYAERGPYAASLGLGPCAEHLPPFLHFLLPCGTHKPFCVKKMSIDSSISALS